MQFQSHVETTSAPHAAPVVGGESEAPPGAENELDSLVVKPSSTTDGRPANGSLYNLVKAIAKDPDAAKAVERLGVAAREAGERLDAKNSKGSTALHACGYLKRWDLAQALLDAGADPLARNAAGHTFFLTAVKEPEAPWELLFAGHPELLDKHRRHLSRRGPRKSRGEAVESPRDAADQAERKDRPEPTAVGSEPFEAGLWEEFAASVPAKGWRATPEACLRWAREAPEPAVEAAIRSGLIVAREAARELCARAVAAGWPARGAWPSMGAKLSEQEQCSLVAAAARAKGPAVELAQLGWAFDEALIEELEESGEYDTADELIDIQSSPPPSISASEPRPPQGARGAKPAAKKPRKAGTKKARARGPRRERKSASMVANLDRPAKEANDYEYRERKPQGKAPLIIVKKARVAIDPSAEG